MMPKLPPLTQLYADDKEGKTVFHQLIKALLSERCRMLESRFLTEDDYRQYGIDGYVKDNYPSFLCPAVFHIKWCRGRINQSPYNEQISDSFQRALNSPIAFRSFVLVTPNDLTENEKTWLRGFEREYKIKSYHIGFSQILELMENMPSLKKYIYGPMDKDAESFELTETKYIHSIRKEFQNLEFIGLPTGQYQRQELLKKTDLLKIYIPLSFKRDRTQTTTLDLGEVLKMARNCIVLGDPGTGKSTLAKYLALVFSGTGTDMNRLGIEMPRIPLIIPIRDFARLKHNAVGPFDFIDYLIHISLKNPHRPFFDPDFFRAKLEMGETIILFDGLDEVAERTKKEEIASLIKSFSEKYPDNIVWVTSRIFGYTENVSRHLENFPIFYLAAIEKKLADNFIEKWYKIQIPDKIEEREFKIHSLKKAIEENDGVRLLQENPLLLTMMTLVHQFEGTLPDDRGRLYEKCIELLLKTWQDQKYILQPGGISELRNRGLKYDEQLRLLAATALQMQKNNRDKQNSVQIGENELKELLVTARYDPSRISEDKAKKDVEYFLDYLRDRVGLFVESGSKNDSGESIFTFIHLSFLEYLAAYQLSEDRSRSHADHIAELLRNLHDPAWSEVIQLALYIFARAPGGNIFIDNFTSSAFHMLDSMNEDRSNCWFLLGRAVRDNINFAREDIKRIILELVDLWLNKPADTGIALSVLKEIHEFSEAGRDYLKKILIQNVGVETAVKAFSSFFLFKKWYPVEEILIDASSLNRDLDRLLPYLPVFRDETLIADFIEEHLDVRQWNIFYNSSKNPIGRNLDRIIDYSIPQNELTGYILCSWSGIFYALQERMSFLEINQLSETERTPIETLCIEFSNARMDSPLNLFQHFLDTIKAYLDTPGNLNPMQIDDKQVFNYREKTVKDDLNQIYLQRWIDGILREKITELDSQMAPQNKLREEDLGQLEDFRKRFRVEFSNFLSNDLIVFFNHDFVNELFTILDTETAQKDPPSYLKSSFYQYLDKDYSKRKGEVITRRMSAIFNRKSSKPFFYEYLHYFCEFFTEEIFKTFFESQKSKFSPEFKQAIVDAFNMTAKEEITWDQVHTVSKKKMYRCFLEQLQEGNNSFIEFFFDYFYMYLFFHELKITFADSGEMAGSLRKYPEKTKEPSILKLKHRFAIPFSFDFILISAIHHYTIKILAHLNQAFSVGDIIPDKEMQKIKATEYCRKYPFQTHILKLVWGIYSRGFLEKTQDEDPLNPIRLAGIISIAAKISLVTDTPCVGKSWEQILEMASESKNIFVQLALTLYRMTIFEDKKKNSFRLYSFMNRLKKKYKEYYRLIGFEVSDKGNQNPKGEAKHEIF